jgi:hypothetical protein
MNNSAGYLPLIEDIRNADKTRINTVVNVFFSYLRMRMIIYVWEIYIVISFILWRILSKIFVSLFRDICVTRPYLQKIIQIEKAIIRNCTIWNTSCLSVCLSVHPRVLISDYTENYYSVMRYWEFNTVSFSAKAISFLYVQYNLN